MLTPKAPSVRLIGGINVTPLVDVCLVLLIIFMVVTPLLDQAPVTLPETEDPGPVSGNEEKKVTISLTRGNPPLIFLGDNPKPISRSALEEKLLDSYAASPATAILMRADQDVAYGDLRAVMMRIRQAGFQRLGLVTKKKESK
jgi:biopolymer transport protein ExbD